MVTGSPARSAALRARFFAARLPEVEEVVREVVTEGITELVTEAIEVDQAAEEVEEVFREEILPQFPRSEREIGERNCFIYFNFLLL